MRDPETFVFGDFRLFAQRRELLLRGVPLQLGSRAFDLLLGLVRRHGQLATKDELMAEAWPDTVVEDNNLKVQISAIRKVLREEPGGASWLLTIPGRGYRFVGPVEREARAAPTGKASLAQSPVETSSAMRVPPQPAKLEAVETATASSPGPQPVPMAARDQRIAFCRTADGVNLAVARIGRGMPLVCTPTWGTHLEYDWQNPIRARLWEFLANRFELIRYDGRGFGLSDRNVTEISLATLARDLETIVDALGLRRYALFCVSTGCPAAIVHAASYPERVTKMVIHDGLVQGVNTWWPAEAIRLVYGYAAIVGRQWGSVALGLIRSTVAESVPSLSPEQVEWCANLLPMTTSPENALRYFSVFTDFDVADWLPKVRAPTLVLHCQHCRAARLQEALRISTSIPKARLVSLESDNLIPLRGEPAWPAFLGAIETFLSEV
jgi:DNA-binding winged helix-turn-helix (wHTH) protein/pimeloyl-ACP methyl ester carboxylesterase